MTLKRFSLAVVALATFVACDDDTASLGVFSETDDIASSVQTFHVTTCSRQLPEVQANASKAYLGRVMDPETDTEIRAQFMAQFHTFENFSLPPLSQLKCDEQGVPVCDSVEVRLYYSTYYGDGDNPMKIDVYELDKDNVLSEDKDYYSTTNILDYIPAGAAPIAQKTFTPEDYTLTDSERTSKTHNKNVRVILPNSYGQDILRKAVDHPEYFVDSWHFMRNVCPGFAFMLNGGLGTMLSLDVSALNIYFNYTKNDSTYVGIARFAATPEVIQTTSISTTSMSRLIDNAQPYTYLKCPAGIATEVSFPVDDIFSGHSNDSISRARLIMQRYNSREQTDYSFGAPSTLLLVMKDSLDAFFGKRKVADGITAVTTSFSSALNVYTFPNLSYMLSYMQTAKRLGMKRDGISSELWDAAHPDWNKAMLVPVEVRTVTNSSTNVVNQVSVTHDFSLGSTRLVGGTQPVDLHVIYSTYQ